VVGFRATLNFNFNILELPVWQYRELLQLQDESPFENITIRHSESELEKTERLNESMELPQVPELDWVEEGVLDWIFRLDKASESEVYTPAYLTEPALEVLEEYKGQNLTRELAEDCLSDISDATSNEIATLVKVGILDPEEYTGESYGVIKGTNLGVREGGVVADIQDEEIIGYVTVDRADNRYPNKEMGEVDAIGIAPIAQSVDDAFEILLEEGIGGIGRLDWGVSLEEGNAVLETKREYGPQYHWYKMDMFHLSLYPDTPPHAEEFLTKRF
jgi:hypothetical protein